MHLVCPRCRKKHKPKKGKYLCDCGSALLVEYKKLKWKPDGKGVWRYQSCLPHKGRHYSLEEGGTPLVKGLDRKAYYKLEGDNPTGSFKDRGTSVVVSRAVAEGFKVVSTASTGNMGASVAAYAAYANIKSRVFVPTDTPTNKLSQIIAYDAELVRVRGSYHDAVERLWNDIVRGSYLAMTGLNPYYIEGEKTIGYELYEDMGAPDKIIVPMGTGGLITAIHKAFVELKQMKKVRKLPEMIGVQPKNCAPIAAAWKEGLDRAERMTKCSTIASAIMVKTPFNDLTALNAMRESKGEAVTVSEAAIKKAVRGLGKEGIFAEPAAATTLAGYEKIDKKKSDKIALIISGSGLKDPSAAL
ncbi:MAG: threonine synthase [Candidatus Diapherotrites archaeon]|nr:threonine synthase [Candidatus Diapherotrites archaeon]